MVRIEPFKGLYYNSQKVKLKNVFVPPYDVISEEEKKAYFKKSPYNYARIILGKDEERGYEKAEKLFQEWQTKKILIEDTSNCFYLWQQKFKHEGKLKKRFELLASVLLDDFKKGQILPHEKTLDAPKSDRLEILKATKANLSPVFMMVEDPDKFLEKLLSPKKQAFIHMKDEKGVEHTLWRIADTELQKKIQNFFEKKTLYIVDGHHRFATALNYQLLSSSRGSNFVLTAITNMSDPSLVIDPIYRVLKSSEDFFWNKESYLRKLHEDFVIRKKKTISQLKKNTWGIMFSKDTFFYELSPKNVEGLLKAMVGAFVVRDLDVSILEQKIIPQEVKEYISYIRGSGKPLKEAFQELKKGKLLALWMAKAPNVFQVKAVADHHEIMPPKSTYFYPKILSGPIIRKL